MSETATRLPLAEAKAIADELVDLLSPSCQRIEVCGSIRRRRPDVGDVDIVAVPKLTTVTTTRQDLFGPIEETQTIDLLAHALDNLCGEQVLRQARRSDGAIQGWGPKLKHAVYQGLKVQVQAVEADCLGMWMVIRTGPAGYSHAFVTPRSQKAHLRDREGKVIGDRPGMLPPGFTVEKGFRLHRHGGFMPTPTEESVFKALGCRYPEPRERK